MAAINEVALDGALRDWLVAILWQWILQNGDKKVTLRIWIIRKTYRIADLHAVFELLLGPQPVSRT